MKEKIKFNGNENKNIHTELERGGERMHEECEVKIYRDRNEKDYYYKGNLVGTEPADEEDFQTEIHEQE